MSDISSILKDEVEGELKQVESFTVRIERFDRDGKYFAVISLYEGKTNENDHHLIEAHMKHSYCDDVDIINKAFYNAKMCADKEISNAGLESLRSQVHISLGGVHNAEKIG